MSGIFQGYTNSNGRVRAAVVTKVPAGSANDRGMVVAGNRVIPYMLDSGQPRTLHDGIAFDSATGMLLAAETPFGPTNISMGGLLVDSRGAVMLTNGNPQVIHQGVGLQNNGRLSIESEPIATFIAHLSNNVASTTGPGAFTRNSDGLYLGADGNWRVAGPNEPRFEDNQLLMEPASTNVFWNSEAPVTQTRTLNTTGEWTISCYGSGNITSANGTGVATGHGTATEGNPVTINVTTIGTFTFTVTGSLDLAQVENQPVVTSPIITQGASASRAADALRWLDSPTFFNQAQGMLVVGFRPRIASADMITSPLNRALVTLNQGDVALTYYENVSFRAFDGTTASSVAHGGFVPNDFFLVGLRWSGVTMQIGRKKNGGAWVWDTERAYDGAWPTESSNLYLLWSIREPILCSDLVIYEEDKGTAWIEANHP